LTFILYSGQFSQNNGVNAVIRSSVERFVLRF